MAVAFDDYKLHILAIQVKQLELHARRSPLHFRVQWLGMCSAVFFGGQIFTTAMKRIPVQLMYQGFLCKKMHRKTSDFEEKTPELVTFRHWVPAGCKNIATFLNFSTFLVVTQICLIPLVDDCQCGYITELGEKNPGCAASFFYHVS
jgi:hypothetical protein